MRSLLLIFYSALLGTVPLCAVQQAGRPSAAAPAVLALKTRLEALERAKQADDPQKVDEASKSVIALALRQMAGLRLLQSAFPEAAELYKRSLDFEELPDTHVDLAVVYLRAKQSDNALNEAANAIFADSQNARAWHVQGKTWMMKKDYRRATESLARSISIEPDLDAAYALGICFLQLHEKAKAANIFCSDARGDWGSRRPPRPIWPRIP